MYFSPNNTLKLSKNRNNVVVYVTAPRGRCSKKIALTLLKARVAACVNIVPSVDSHYWWERKLHHGKESLLIIKTQAKCVNNLIALVQSIHPYTTPEIIALPIQSGFKPYLNWIYAETK
jgi:periplasmic divalent cation tolerance protein